MAVGAYVLFLLAMAAFMLYASIRLDFIEGFHPQITITIYNLLSGIQLALIILLVPAITAGQINGERERQTLDLMLVTKMSTFTIVVGKLLSSLMLVLLMIVASVPVFGAFVYFGAVSPAKLLEQTLFMLVTATMAGSVSILCSIVFKRAMVAYVFSYFVMLLLTTITAAVVGSIFNVLHTTHFNNMQLGGIFVPFILSLQWRELFTWLLALNPVVGFLSLQDAQSGTVSLDSFLTQFLFNFQDVRLTTQLPLWLVNIWINIGLSCVFVGLSSWLLMPARRLGKFSFS